MSEQQTQVGFKCEFVKKLEESFETGCPICKLVLREPYQAECCGKSYCKDCISTHKAQNKPCLVCDSKSFTLFHNKGLQKSIYGLCVYCSHKSEGCDWRGELKELDTHLNVHPLATKSLEGCQFEIIECPMSYAGCEVKLPRKEIEGHITDVQTSIHHQLRGAEIQKCVQSRLTNLEKMVKALLDQNQQMDLQIKNLQGDKQYLQQQNMELEHRVGELEERYEVATRIGMAIGPVRFTMHNFEQHKQRKDSWFSPPFYTNPQGYKICLCVVANGEGPADGQYTSVLIHMMKGDYDRYLKWPFRVVITVHLLDQDGNEDNHHKQKIYITDRTPNEVAKRVMDGERAEFGWGMFHFIEHEKLEPNYLKNDCLCFEIGQIELK